MATTLAQQLQRLAVPQSSIYKQDKKKPSLLFDPKEAAQKDKDFFYEIGVKGLKELINIYEGFRLFEDTLFNQSSKDFERAMQTKEVNENLNMTIEKFLKQVSPYLLLASSHKALEWLVHRYQIHNYNQDAIMACILPFHETKIFVRFIQLLDLSNPINRWHWLVVLQKPGLNLSRQVLYNHCASNYNTLRFISNAVLSYVNEFGERATQLSTLFAFFCSTTVGTLNSMEVAKESFVTAILPAIMKGLSSSVSDFRSSIYIILGYLATKTNIKRTTLNDIVIKLLTSEVTVTYDMVLLANIIYSTNTHYTTIPEDVLYCISAERMNSICEFLKRMVSQNISIEKFILSFLSSVLPLMQENIEEFRRSHLLPELLIDEVDLSSQNPIAFITCIIKAFRQNEPVNVPVKDNESDLEIVEDDFQFDTITEWYSNLLKSLERKYPTAFDRVVKELLGSKELSQKRLSQLTKLLGFNPALSHKVGDTYLFEKLNSRNAELRVQAVEYIGKRFESLKNENAEFLKESIVNRFYDDKCEVVKAALAIPMALEILTSDDLANIFVSILSKGNKKFKKWQKIIYDTIKKFCKSPKLPVTQATVLSIMPYLFPEDVEGGKIWKNIVTSNWGQRFNVTRKISKFADGFSTPDVMCEQVFKFRTEKPDLSLNYNLVDKTNSLAICFYLYFKVQTLHETNLDDVITLLNNLVEFFEKLQIIVIPDVPNSLSAKLMPHVINIGRQGNIAFPMLQYIFENIITNTNLSISKPWVNLCETSESVLCRRLFELFCTGSTFSNFDEYYVVLLQKLLQKLCSNTREIMEFIANIACGHILFANDPKDIVTPELQLRAMKLFILGIDKSAEWIFDSDVVICMILINLNNPVTIIRECTIEIIEQMLSNQTGTSNAVMLLKQLLEHKEELLIDHEQICQVLKTILTQHENKIFRKNCQNLLIGIAASSPPHISAELLRILYKINTSQAFIQMLKAADAIQETMTSNELNTYQFDIYESKLLRHLLSRINENIVTSFNNDRVWDFVTLCMKEHKNVVLFEDQSTTSPSVLLMKQITEDIFNKISDVKCTDMIYMICSAGTFSNDSSISSVAAKTFKKIHVDISQFRPILEEMLNVQDTAVASKKSKSTVSMISCQLAETNEWKLGVTLLEYIQSKTKMSIDNTFVILLFNILKKCLKFEEQSCVEYPKQLILSSLWHYCKIYVNDNDEEQLKSLKAIFDIECVVLCIRGTQNPQTHHHALILLSHAAYMLPDQVLHHTMEIFTFMGSSVLRHDDAYSFQIINKIIETLIPILVKLDKNVKHYDESEFVKLQSRVVPVLRIFADVVLHVPEHRRLPLYKKLLDTLDPQKFLWMFIALLLETHIAHWNENKNIPKNNSRNLANQESPINRLDFGQSILLEFSPEIVFDNFVKIINYIKSLPVQKDDNAMVTDINSSDIFSVNGHTAVQLRHYKYVLITFMNTALSSSPLIQHSKNAKSTKVMEDNYKCLIVNILTFIQSISKISDEKTMKYWRVMLHHSYDLLDNVNSLLSAKMFVSVIRGLLKHTLHTVRRKAMELLNTKIQAEPEFFAKCDNDLMLSMLPPLLDIIQTIETEDDTLNEAAAQELQLNQQTALLSLKLLIRYLGTENPDAFIPVLDKITEYTCNLETSGNVRASVVLCLGELCYTLKAYSLTSLRKFMPALIKVLKKQRKAETPELILLSTVTAISKIVESVPRFLSPYLSKILLEYSLLFAKWENCDQGEAKVSAIVNKLCNIRKKVAAAMSPRILIPVISCTYYMLLEKECYQAIGPLMAVLAESFMNFSSADFASVQKDLTAFFLAALQLRSDTVDKEVDGLVIDGAEEKVIDAFVGLVLKLSETSFRPFYFKIYDWAIRSNVDEQKDRVITFYRMSIAIADKLKGLFVLFAGHFIKNAADLLDACNTSKTEHLYFDSDQKCSILIEHILKTLHVVFLYDNQNFINKERFEALMQPLVDQLENTLMGLGELKRRAVDVLIPCISQFAVTIADDSLWKLLNYQILLKTRHNDAEIRLMSLECLVSMASQLGSSWLPLLAESVPFLAELLEDGDPKIENATKDSIRKLEQILGEPLEKYF